MNLMANGSEKEPTVGTVHDKNIKLGLKGSATLPPPGYSIAVQVTCRRAGIDLGPNQFPFFTSEIDAC